MLGCASACRPEQGGSKEGREAVAAEGGEVAAGALQALSQAPGALPDSAHKWQPEHWADEYFRSPPPPRAAASLSSFLCRRR